MSDRPLVVLLGHQAHVGKDMLGAHLVENHGFTRFAFADKLKQVVADLYDFSGEHMYGALKNEPTQYTKETETIAEVRGDGYDLTLEKFFVPKNDLELLKCENEVN